ncbi:MAG: bifunctional DNA primase/polymerase [Thaumarchaeota archaeon]|nr:bifunctional DNA primase/polymerase [Nitrososphaerota archaeon]
MIERILDFFPERRPKFLNSASLGEKRTLTIESAAGRLIRDQMKVVVTFKEIENGLILNRVNAEVLSTIFGPNLADLVGKRISLEVVPVEYKGQMTKGIRVAKAPPGTPGAMDFAFASFPEWEAHVDRYIEWGWTLIPIRPYSKGPFSKEHWLQDRFSRDSILQNILHQGNLGVVCGPSKLVVLDIDVDSTPDVLDPSASLTQRTARGWQIYLTKPFDDPLFQKLREIIPGLDLPRVGGAYSVAPLSATCSFDHGKNHRCRVHDLHVRRWVGRGLEGEAIPFTEYARLLLK